ncbi:MAG: hypothetical protein AAF600_20445 [Bacteroidota bacterium]
MKTLLALTLILTSFSNFAQKAIIHTKSGSADTVWIQICMDKTIVTSHGNFELDSIQEIALEREGIMSKASLKLLSEIEVSYGVKINSQIVPRIIFFRTQHPDYINGVPIEEDETLRVLGRITPENRKPRQYYNTFKQFVELASFRKDEVEIDPENQIIKGRIRTSVGHFITLKFWFDDRKINYEFTDFDVKSKIFKKSKYFDKSGEPKPSIKEKADMLLNDLYGLQYTIWTTI